MLGGIVFTDTEKKRVSADIEAARVRQVEQALDAERARKSKKLLINYLFQSAIGAIVSGWCAFIVVKMTGGAAMPYIVIAALGGAGVCFLFLFWKERALQTEGKFIRHVRSLPGFRDDYHRDGFKSLMLWGAMLAIVMVGAPVAANYFPRSPVGIFVGRYLPYIIGGMFTAMFVFFYLSHRRLYRIKCPQCGEWLRVRSRRHESEDTYSGLCKPCGILWDLDVSNTD